MTAPATSSCFGSTGVPSFDSTAVAPSSSFSSSMTDDDEDDDDDDDDDTASSGTSVLAWVLGLEFQAGS